MNRRSNHPPNSRPHGRGFVLMEVIVTLTILSIALTAFLRSFTQAMDTAKKMEIMTQAIFFAEQLQGEFEIHPPEEGESEGGFGDYYAPYYYEVEVIIEEPDYDDQGLAEDQIDQFFASRTYNLKIFYDDGTKKNPWKVFEIDSAVIQFEKFSRQTKSGYAQY